MLAYAFCDKSTALRLLDAIRPEYFRPAYREFVRILLSCIEKYKEIPTLRILQSHDNWESALEEIFNNIQLIKVEPAEFLLDRDKLIDRYNTQLLLKLGKEVYKDNRDGKQFADLDLANKSLRTTVAEIERLRISKVYKKALLRDTAQQSRDKYFEIKSNPQLARGLHVGLREFDRITNGLRPAELILVGGESNAGKSALVMNMALNAWRGSNPYPDNMEWVKKGHYDGDGAHVMYFSLEMPHDPLRRRIDACLAGVPLNGIRDGNLSAEEEERFVAATTFQENYDKEFEIIDIPRGCTPAQVESLYLENITKFEPDLIIVDYITLMKSEYDDEADWLNVGHLSAQLHEFCRAYSVPCVTPVQLNRPQGQNGKRLPPDQHRTGRSAMIPQNANIQINIYTRGDEDQRPDMEIHIAKMRDGEKGAFVLHKRLDIMRLYDDVPGWTPEMYKGDESQ